VIDELQERLPGSRDELLAAQSQWAIVDNLQGVHHLTCAIRQMRNRISSIVLKTTL
jgi:hypothetical protein